MVVVFLLVLILGSSHASDQNLTINCEEAIAKATAAHWDYVEGKIPYQKSWEATKAAEKICGFSLTAVGGGSM
jgi:hypothetical protein